MTLKARITSPTPSFFRKLRKIGLILAGIGAAIIAAPISLPAMVVSAAGYLTVAGAVTTAVSQAVTHFEGDDEYGYE